MDGPAELVIAAADVTDMFAHALDENPNECCGLLAGTGGRVVAVYRMTNADHSPFTYTLDSREQIRTMRAAEELGLEIVGVYHSHTHTEPYPSPTDVRNAFEPQWIYVLVGLRRDAPEFRAYRITGGNIDEIPVVVTEGEGAPPG